MHPIYPGQKTTDKVLSGPTKDTATSTNHWDLVETGELLYRRSLVRTRSQQKRIYNTKSEEMGKAGDSFLENFRTKKRKKETLK